MLSVSTSAHDTPPEPHEPSPKTPDFPAQNNTRKRCEDRVKKMEARAFASMWFLPDSVAFIRLPSQLVVRRCSEFTVTLDSSTSRRIAISATNQPLHEQTRLPQSYYQPLCNVQLHPPLAFVMSFHPHGVYIGGYRLQVRSKVCQQHVLGFSCSSAHQGMGNAKHTGGGH